MKKFIVVLSVILLSMPAFALNEKAVDVSLDYLNKSVYSQVHSFNQVLYADEDKIIRIKKAGIQNLSKKGVNNFASACIQRHQNLLNTYKNDYFLPAYKKYKEIDNTVNFEDWINSVALSETSLFYEFYRFTELNLEDCQKIYNLSK